MKVDTVANNGFRPVTLTITLETQEETEELFNMLDHAANVSYCKNFDCRSVREALEKSSGVRLGLSFSNYSYHLRNTIK